MKPSVRNQFQGNVVHIDEGQTTASVVVKAGMLVKDAGVMIGK